jgi:hypothetical protein
MSFGPRLLPTRYLSLSPASSASPSGHQRLIWLSESSRTARVGWGTSMANPRRQPCKVPAASELVEGVSGSAIMKRAHMNQRVVMIRLVALLVLITSASDYCAFDVWDPSAPMSAAGSEAIRDLVQYRQASVKMRPSELPDDHCLCCSPWIAPRRPALPRASLSSTVTQAAKASLPSSDPILIEHPPRA